MREAPTTSDASILKRRHFALAILFLVIAFSFADRTLINVALPAIKTEFRLTDSELGLLAGLAFAVVNCVFAVPIAKIADKSSRTLVLTIAVGLWSAVTAATSAVSTFVQLISARMALGLAEAGGSAPSHSVIADLYRPSERATALAIYNSGASAGGFFGLLIGGWIMQMHGWRAAYLVFGAAGIVLAILMLIALREPPRGLTEDKPATASGDTAPASVIGVFKLALSRPTFMHVTLGNAINAMGTFGVGAWLPSFLTRSHGMSIAEATSWLAPMLLVSGVISQIGGGWLSDKFGRRDFRLTLVVPAIIMLIGYPIEVAAFLVDQTWLALLLLFIGNMSVGPFSGSVMSTVQGLAGLRQRTIAAATMLMVVGLVGAGLGPYLSGVLSDVFGAQHGADSLRLALAAILVCRLWAALHIYLASRTVVADLARRPG